MLCLSRTLRCICWRFACCLALSRRWNQAQGGEVTLGTMTKPTHQILGRAGHQRWQQLLIPPAFRQRQQLVQGCETWKGRETGAS